MVLQIILGVVLGIVGVAVIVAAGYVLNNLNYFAWDMNRVKKAGFTEKQFTVGDTVLNYAEGPDNGPPLLLIHAQVVDWENYAKVLPALSKGYHIFAVDCHGHGKSSKNPEEYNVEAMGGDFAQFIAQVIKEPAVVSGHSSGGLITAWLAANAPGQVAGVVLEDPPFFSSEQARTQKTFNYVDLSVPCHNFLAQSEEKDFTAYYLKNCAWMKFFQGGQKGITEYALSYREKHPDTPIKLFFLPPSINESLRATDTYDPRFGETFYNSSWHKNFDHAEALAKIDCPSVLIHTSWSYGPDGILWAAMDGNDAERAHSLIKGNVLINVKSGHGFHFDHPREFIKIMLDFKEQFAA